MGPRGPQTKHPIFWGVVSLGVQTMGSEHHYGKCTHIYRDSYILGELSIGAQMLGSAQTSQFFFLETQVICFFPRMLEFAPAVMSSC